MAASFQNEAVFFDSLCLHLLIKGADILMDGFLLYTNTIN